MFLASIFQSVLAGLQDNFAQAILQWLTSFVNGIVPGLLGGS